MLKMLPEPKKLLLDALRYGGYIQGQGRLTTAKDGRQFDCCLGVACKLAIRQGISLETTEVDFEAGENFASLTPRKDEEKPMQVVYNEAKYYLPHDVTVWLFGSTDGIENVSGRLGYNPFVRTEELVDQNEIEEFYRIKRILVGRKCSSPKDIGPALLNDFGFSFNEIADFIEKYF